MTIGGEEGRTMCLFVSGDEWNKIKDQIKNNGKRRGWRVNALHDKKVTPTPSYCTWGKYTEERKSGVKSNLYAMALLPSLLASK